MSKFAVLLCLLCSASLLAETPTPQPKPPATQVEFHGKLRHGVVAMGGETTGTTITSEGITWELKLPDNSTRDFAKEHHKQPVTAKGLLRRVAATETDVRWIVEVDTLTKRDADMTKEGVSLKTSGILLASDKPDAGLELMADGIPWPLDFGKSTDIKAEAKSLTGKLVILEGLATRDKQATKDSLPTVLVTSVKEIPMKKSSHVSKTP